MHPRTRARLAALRTLAQIETSDRSLAAILDAASTPPESLPFARELSSGATRWRSRLDWTLQPILSKPIEKLDAPVRAALRLAAYERIVLQTPANAVANEYAEMMRREKKSSAVGFVNAIARRLPSTWRDSPPRDQNPAAFLATETAHPEWMCARWIDRLGFDAAHALCQANNEVAPLDLRVNTARATRDEVLAALQTRGVEASATNLSPDNIRVARAAKGESLAPWTWPEWEAGLLLAQDEAAQLVALALGAGPYERVLDVASAPGGKATHLAQLMRRGEADATGFIVAADKSAERLGKVRENVTRLQLPNVRFFEGEARQVLLAIERGDFEAFDSVLLDAPCSGTGTLRRRPDAKWRKSIENLAQLVELQAELMDAAAACVQPGGALCYSTCSVEVEENSGAALAFLSRHAGWRVEEPLPLWVGEEVWKRLAVADLPGAVATRPGRDGSDGMFCVVMRRPE